MIRGHVEIDERKQSILRWLRRKQPTEFSVRTVQNAMAGRSWAKVDAIRQALDLLEADGIVRFQERAVQSHNGKGAPSEIYSVVTSKRLDKVTT